ncbi:ribonuclease HII [Neobacillus notoginsengisoli]|uniref:Ribonuclease HII n=1 Tax=Neobacillus notoginsengisoli TaxID=1578198 RepID=A0A417YQP0_9BACI|nr:ribonuclease HII [Neobacillus notoginsengisoli]RHW36422.1 ribonuclease HII [Neobacillus notoginsengisoli]
MEKLSIGEIGAILSLKKDETDPFISEAEKDGRKGVQKLLMKWKKDREEEKKLKEKFYEMTLFERKARSRGYKLIAGIDEAGRGPLAGPVVAAAVILPEDFFLPGLDDSKKIPARKRHEYERIIKQEALAFYVSFVSAQEIDRLNIYQATIKAMKTAAASLNPIPDYLLVDAVNLETPFPVEPIIKGDAKSISIAAASILAKSARDRFMVELAQMYPSYGFEKNMGYGTKEHLGAIEKYGATPYHRKSFAPIKPTM